MKDSSKALIYRKGETGPSFGKDLVLGKTISSSLGHSYECDSNLVIDSLPAKITFLEAEKVQAKEMEVWQLCF